MRPARLLLLIALGPTVVALDSVDRSQVSVGGFRLTPLGNLRQADDRIEWHPKALLGFGYNSNVAGVENGEAADTVLRGVAGLEMRIFPLVDHLVVLDAELDAQDYQDLDQFDRFGGRASAEWTREGPRLLAAGRARYQRDGSPLIESGEQLERDEMALVGEAAWRALVARYGGTVIFERVDFRDGGRFFTEDNRDHTVAGLDVRFGMETARDTERYLRLAIDQVDYDLDERYPDSTGGRLLAGWRGRLGERSSLRIEAGVAHRQYRELAGQPSENVTRPSAAISFTWPWETGSALNVRLFSEIQDSVDGAGSWVYGTSANIRWRLLLNAGLFAGAGIDRRVGEGGVANASGTDRTTMRGDGGAEYYLREGVAVRLIGTVTESDADMDDDDYSRWTMALELAAAL